MPKFNTPEETAKYYLESGENILLLTHNTVIEIKRVNDKANQTYRYYGGEEAESDKVFLDFNKKVLQLVTVNNPSARRLYGHYFL